MNRKQLFIGHSVFNKYPSKYIPTLKMPFKWVFFELGFFKTGLFFL